MEPRIIVDKDDNQPAYRCLAKHIRFAIQTGRLQPGTALPSLREVARNNGLSLTTAIKAYAELEALGLIESAPRKGFRVSGSIETHSADPGDTTSSFSTEQSVSDASATDDAGRYAARGVSSSKREIHSVVDRLSRGAFPGAFCKLTEDFLTGDPDRCNVIHSDGSGTKSTLAYLHWKEFGDVTVWRGIAQDSIVMNVDDLLCVGCTGGVLISSTLNRNARRIPGEVLAQLIEGTEECLENLREWGFSIHSGGGETADVGDLTPTITVDSCATAVMRKSRVIDGSRIRPGLAIVGLSSSGKACYESSENSGIGSNGLTSARHELLKGWYRKRFPETFDASIPKELVYSGPYRMGDPLPDSSMTVGAALLSPTRTYAPFVVRLMSEFQNSVAALIHCSGGGQTKCLRFGTAVHFVKDSLLPIPPLFAAIQKAGGTKWREMFQVFNMGHRMEVYCQMESAEGIVALARSLGIDAAIVGHTESSSEPDNSNHLSIHFGKKVFRYKAAPSTSGGPGN